MKFTGFSILAIFFSCAPTLVEVTGRLSPSHISIDKKLAQKLDRNIMIIPFDVSVKGCSFIKTVEVKKGNTSNLNELYLRYFVDINRGNSFKVTKINKYDNNSEHIKGFTGEIYKCRIKNKLVLIKESSFDTSKCKFVKKLYKVYIKKKKRAYYRNIAEFKIKENLIRTAINSNANTLIIKKFDKSSIPVDIKVEADAYWCDRE